MRVFNTLAVLALATSTGCLATDGGTGDSPDMGVRPSGKADGAFVQGPMYLSGAFDGSQRFGMWVDTMAFARRIKKTYGKQLSFTYFINTCFYDHTVKGSAIGTAVDAKEETVRWALTQEALNQGHEIGSHTVRHLDGSKWTADQWRKEMNEFHALVSKHLFQPIFDTNGKPVFPNWTPAPGVAQGKTGASCSTSDDCDSGKCEMVTETAGFCTQACNSNKKCPGGTVCGVPFTSDTDVCLPTPQFPISYNGRVLFDAAGQPNLANPDLKPYKVVGFRAPLLGSNAAMYQVLTELGYKYDTSQILAPGAPTFAVREGKSFKTIYELPLMKNSGSLTVPMDYNYYVNDGAADRMKSDYRKSITDAYGKRNKQPWNIGHHFALWKNGGYWASMQDAFEFAAKGCPDSAGTKACGTVEFPSFVQLAAHLDGKADSTLWDDSSVEDYQDTTTVADESEEGTH